MFRSYAQAAADVAEWSLGLPDDIVAVCGVPRSGTIIATMLAQHRQLHLVEWSELVRGVKPWTNPLRRNVSAKSPDGIVLVVDDTSHGGSTLKGLRSAIPSNTRLGALYVGEGGKAVCDHWFAEVPTRFHSFEWNFLRDTPTKRVCVDLDGTLCEDWTLGEEEQFPEEYAAHLRDAKPIRRVDYPVYAVVTARLEKHRAATAAWLERNGIKHSRLVMHPARSSAERTAIGFGKWKADIYRSFKDSLLFVENDPRQAKEIHRGAGKAVLLVPQMTMLGGLEPIRRRTVVRVKTGPPRVAFLTSTLGMGGAERCFIDTAAEWRRTGAARLVGTCLTEGGQSWTPFCRELSAIAPIHGTVHPAKEPLPNDHEFVTRHAGARDAMTEAIRNANIVVAWGVPQIRTMLPASWDCPVVLLCQESTKAESRLESAASDATHFVAVSDIAVRMFPEAIRDRVKIIPNGCNLERIRVKTPRAETRARWGVSGTIIAHVGRLDVDKNPLAVVRACAGTEWIPALIGRGQWEGPISKEARKIDPRVVIPGPVDEVGSVFHAIDCYVLVSPAEGDSIALKEALAFGLPVVATNVGGLPTMESSHGKLCVTVPVDPDAETLREAIRTAMSPHAIPLRQHAMVTAATHFTVGRSAADWAKWLGEILATGRS